MTEQKTQACFALSIPAVVLAILAAGTTACSSDDASYAPYPGTAYPNRRPSFANNGHILGYIANRKSDSVSVIDLDTMTVLGEAPVGRDPVDLDGPRHVVLDENAGVAYVALSYPEDVVSPHAAEGTTERLGYLLALDISDLSPLGEQRLEPNAEDVVFSPERDELLVTHDDPLRALLNTELGARRAAIDFVSPASRIPHKGASVRRLIVCVAPKSTIYREDGARAYVACTGEDDLTVVDTTIPAVLSRVPAGEGAANQPYAIVADAKEERLLVSNQVARTIAIFSMTDEPELMSTVYLMGVPVVPGWISDAEFVVPTQDYNGAVLVDAETATIVREVSYSLEDCARPSEARPTPDGRLFIVCEGDQYAPGAIVRVDPTTLELLERTEIGIYPDRLALRFPAP